MKTKEEISQLIEWTEECMIERESLISKIPDDKLGDFNWNGLLGVTDKEYEAQQIIRRTLLWILTEVD